MAGTEVGSLYYDMDIDPDNRVDKQLDEKDKKVKSFGSTLSKFGDNVQAGFRDVSKVLAVAGAGLLLYAKNATEFTVDFVKSSKALGVQIGVTTTEASRLVAALGRMGIEASDASQMFGIFSKNIVASTTAQKDNALAVQKLQIQIEATQQAIKNTTVEIQKNGDKSGELTLKLKALQNQLATQQNELNKTADSFQKLGISTTDATGKQKDFNTILFEVADKFKAMPDGVDKTTIALDLFGRSGKDMIKVLNLGSSGIQDLEKQADKLGLTLNATTIGAVNKLVQSQKDLKEQTDAMKIAVGTATAPVLTKFNEKLVQVTNSLLNAPEPIKSITVNTLAFGGAISSAASGVFAFLGNISSITPKIAALALRLGAAGLVIGVVVGGVVLLQDQFHFLDNVVGSLRNSAATLKAMWDTLAAGFNNSQGPLFRIGSVFNAIYTVGRMLGEYWRGMLKPALDILWQTIRDQLWPALSQLWQSMVNLYHAMQPALTEALRFIAIILGTVLVASIMASVIAINIVIQVITVLANVISTVINWIALFVAWIRNAAINVANAIASVGSWFSQLPRYAANAVLGAVGWFASLPGRILGAIGNLGGLLYRAGVDLVNGMINGVVGTFSQLAARVRGAVGAAVQSIKNFLGIRSPSKVFHEIGTNVTKGFINGINANANLAAKAMGSFADAVIAPTVNLTPASATAGGGGVNHNYGGTTITIGTVEDRQDADYIINRIDQDYRRQTRGVAP